MDEIRVVSGALSANWITTEFTNQSNPAAFLTVGQEEKSKSPVLYLNFDEGNGTVTRDTSGNSNNGGIRGASWQSQKSCLSENCLYYDGIDDQVIATNAASIDFDQGMNLGSGSAFQAWVKVNSDGENRVGRIYDKGNATYLRTTNEANGKVDLEASLDLTTTDAMATVSAGLTLNKWHLVTVGYTDDGDDHISVYIDGVLRATSTTGAGPPETDANNLLIGGQNGKHFNGYIDEFKVYDYERTPAEVKSDYGQVPSLRGKSVSVGDERSDVNNGLIGWWKLDETGTSNATDSAGLASSMLKNNNTTDFTFGKFGNSAWFNGSNNYFSTATPIGNIQTVSFWASPSASTSKNLINLNGSVYITTDAQSKVLFNGATSPKVYVNGVENGTVTASAWNHIVATTDTALTTTSFEIARANSTVNVNGKIDDVRLYNRPLSPADIRALYDWAPEPVGWWKLDERQGTTANDTSGNGYSGTLTNGPVWTSGKIGQAVNFDGSNDYISITDNTAFEPGTSDFSTEAWINTQNLSTDQAIIGHFNSSSPFAGWEFGLNFDVCGSSVGTPALCVWDGTNSVGVKASGISLNTWAHVALVRTGTNGYFYVNGILAGSISTIQATLPGSSQPIRIGYGNDSTDPFNGKIDDVKYFSYARTPKQIVSDMNAGHPAVGSPVGSAVAHWKFDEGYGTTAHNTGSGGSDLDLPLGSAPTAPSWTNSGKFGKALAFDGVDDYLEEPDNSAFEPPDDMSISFWTYPNQTASNKKEAVFLVYKNHTAPPWFSYQLYINDPDDKLTLDWRNTASVQSETISKTPLTTNRWYHVVYTKNGSGGHFYIDGIDDTETSGTYSGTMFDSDDVLWVGGVNSTPAYVVNGKMDDLKIYNYALSTDEVKTEFNQGKALVLGALSTEGTIGSSASASLMAGSGSDSGANGGTIVWNLPGNITADDAAAAQATYGGGSGTYLSQYLTASQFGFTIPTTATIKGITVEINKYRSGGTGGTIADTEVKLTNSGGSLVGNNRASATAWSTSPPSPATYGGTSDTWAAGLTPSDINSANFGVVLSATCTSCLNRVGNVDYIKITVNYTFPETAGVFAQSRAYCPPGNAEANCATGYDPAPVGEWKFDERSGTTANDTSGNGNTGTLTGFKSNQWVPGKNGSSLYFNGGTSGTEYINAGNSNSLLPEGNPLTLEAWINPKSAGGGTAGRIIFRESGVGSGFGIGLNIYQSGTNALEFGVDGDTKLTAHSANNSIILNQWNHVVATWDGGIAASGVQLYINGQSAKSGSQDGVNVNNYDTSPFNALIGNRDDLIRAFDGFIDDVRIYNYARTPAQIAWDYNQGKPVGWWKLDECQGTTAYDSSGNRYDMTITAGTSAGNNDSAGTCNSGAANPTNEMWNAGTNGKFNASISIDNVNDYASTSGTTILAPANQTYSTVSWGGWIYKTSIGLDVILEKTREFRFATDASNFPGCYIWTAGAWSTGAMGTSAVTQNSWQHVLCTYDGTNIKTYVNGVLVATISQTATITSQSQTPLVIGRDMTGAAQYGGLIDDIRVYNYTLTTAQIKTLINENSAIRFGPLTESP